MYFPTLQSTAQLGKKIRCCAAEDDLFRASLKYFMHDKGKNVHTKRGDVYEKQQRKF